MKAPDFWQQVEDRRNLFFICWIGWIPVGLLFMGIYQGIFEHEPPPAVAFSLFVVWGSLWILTALRLRQLRCPKCHKQAIAHPFFLMRDVRCKHCGLSNEHA